ncbi:hypothetical protein ACJDU8_23985 [Clostridium sp. WILCCON 0269]|uniref:DNA-binding protein n=1 Tax=Candidatus Clostridium eludens TaxID=3381663 RepID=A0ABW8SUD9_9CLOT
MNKEEFLNLSIEDKVKYFNVKIKEMGSYSKVCKELGISVSLTGTFKKHGWILSGDRDKFIHDESLDKGINSSTKEVKNINNNIPGQETLFDTTDELINHQDTINDVNNSGVSTHLTNPNENSSNSNDMINFTEESHNCFDDRTISLENGLDSTEPTTMEREGNENSKEVKRSTGAPSNNKNDDLTYIESNSKQAMEKIGHMLTGDTEEVINQDEATYGAEILKKDETHENNTKSSINDVSNSENIEDTKIKKPGRPSKPGRKKYSLNLDIADFKQLQIHCIINDLSPSDVVGELIKDFLTKRA